MSEVYACEIDVSADCIVHILAVYVYETVTAETIHSLTITETIHTQTHIYITLAII